MHMEATQKEDHIQDGYVSDEEKGERPSGIDPRREVSVFIFQMF